MFHDPYEIEWKGSCTMSINIALTLTGSDRVGIVEEVTQLLLKLGGNIEASRMSRLGGEFAILMLVSLPSDLSSSLDKAISELSAQGYKVTTTPTESTYAQAHAGWQPYQIEVKGADHEGIIHKIAQTLSRSGIRVEAMDTGTTHAPNSGTPLFTMSALVAVPAYLPERNWQAALEDAGHGLHVDIRVSAVPRP
jgi:glycine cleavage system transcriptional repressor